MTHPRRNIKRKASDVHDELDGMRKVYENEIAGFHAGPPRLESEGLWAMIKRQMEEDQDHTIDIPHEEVTPKQLPPKK